MDRGHAQQLVWCPSMRQDSTKLALPHRLSHRLRVRQLALPMRRPQIASIATNAHQEAKKDGPQPEQALCTHTHTHACPTLARTQARSHARICARTHAPPPNPPSIRHRHTLHPNTRTHIHTQCYTLRLWKLRHPTTDPHPHSQPRKFLCQKLHSQHRTCRVQFCFQKPFSRSSSTAFGNIRPLAVWRFSNSSGDTPCLLGWVQSAPAFVSSWSAKMLPVVQQ
jgi:hypothetical protein